MSRGNPNDPPDRERLFEIDYKRRDDDIRHYSTTRSALTSFLMTVGLGLLSYYFSNSYPERPRFLWITGFTLLAAALCACFVFSWRTERSALFRKALWDWATGKLPDYPNWEAYKKSPP